MITPEGLQALKDILDAHVRRGIPESEEELIAIARAAIADIERHEQCQSE